VDRCTSSSAPCGTAPYAYSCVFQGDCNYTALSIAAYQGYTDIITMLVSAGSDVNYDGDDQVTFWICSGSCCLL
jgi:hypothetical protein